MPQIEYKYGKKTIVADIKYSNRKTIGLRVFPEGHIEITAPINSEFVDVIEKVKKKSKWILDQQKTFELYKPFTTERKFISGETHRYLGRQYKLIIEKVESNTKSSISLAKGQMLVRASKNDVENIILNFYKSKANTVFQEILTNLLKENTQFKDFEILLSNKWMKKRWGSCSTNGNIILNTELVRANKHCIEYVVLHELCHLVHHNHSKEFYSLLGELMPDWEKFKEKLEKDLN